MSKLIERLKQLNSVATKGVWWNEWCSVESPQVEICTTSTGLSDRSSEECVYNAMLIAETHNALPKLLAVVEAAQLLAGDGVIDDGMYIVESRFHSRLKQALATLEKEG